ncbi:MAG: carboxypeptidase regulatory-like domain-containing protein, partial [Methanobrevibacter sp.]|nr:carboxypeptidase regulatory-like domain-containing protein [Methanobrevibacter sp.]
SQNFITLSLKAVKSGKSDLVYSLNNNFVNSIKLKVNEYGALISANDVKKYYKGSERFNVYLKDVNNDGISGQNVTINVNGVDYVKTTNDNGLASIALNLNSGNYTVSASYAGAFGKNSTTANVNVLHTISGNDIVKMYRNDTQYYAKFLDASGKPLVNVGVQFNINGVFYTRTTDNNGQAKLNINLNPGDYILTTINSNNGEQHSNNVKVLPILVDGHDITKYYRNDSAYSIKVLDNVGNPLANADVKFNINGVFYTRTTNESGYANLNLRLQPGSYVVTAEYNSLKYTNIVTILPVLFADDAVSHTNATNFKARLIDGQGKPYANQSIDFNINGVIYTNVTDSEGIANLIVNLADGEYIVTSSYDEYNINNKITVKNEA